MKKALALFSLLLLPGQLAAAEPSPATPSSPGKLAWTVAQTWKTSVKPVDFAQSLDGRLVFVLGEDSQVHIYSTEGQDLGAVPVDKDTKALDISPRGEMLYLVSSSNAYKAIDISFVKSIDITGSPFLGKENAKAVLVVFSDFQCPYCGQVQPLLDELLKKNPDNLKVVFKHLPLSMHYAAELSALAAIAAQEQGKFWQMHNELFAAVSSWPRLPPQDPTVPAALKEVAANIEKIAASIGLNMEKFKADWNSEAVKQKLEKDVTSARLAEINGTPSLLVNGRRVNEPRPDVIQSMINQELVKK